MGSRSNFWVDGAFGVFCPLRYCGRLGAGDDHNPSISKTPGTSGNSTMKRLARKAVERLGLMPFLRLPIRQRMLNWFMQRCIYRTQGLTCSVHFTSRVTHADRLVLGANVWYQLAVSGGCYVQASNGIEIGDNTLIAPGVKIISANHRLDDHSRSQTADPIRIGSRCWLGANSVILPGVQLGEEVVVGAGAVVTGSFASRSIIGGVPARLLRTLEHDGSVRPLFAE